MSTHDDATDPKDLNGSEIMKPDPKFQSFFVNSEIPLLTI